MSNSAQAVPTAGAPGDGLNEDSVMGSPTAISGLQCAVTPATGEVPVRTGQVNLQDPYLYNQFIYMNNITWSTTALEGTVLWYIPLHPSRMNQFISYFSQPYNTWRGSMEFKFKIMGTGFHAGSLGFCRLPPNIHPTSVGGVSNFTAFEYEAIDPKEVSYQTRVVIDQLNTDYHLSGALDENDPKTFGGWFVIFVLSPLRTSSTGNNNVSVVVMNRAGQDFTLSQMKPIVPIDNSSSLISAAQALFPRNTALSDPYTMLPISNFVITNSTVGPPNQKFNVTNFDGQRDWGSSFGTWSLGTQMIQCSQNEDLPSLNGSNYQSSAQYRWYAAANPVGTTGELINRPMSVQAATQGIYQPKYLTVEVASDKVTLTGTPLEASAFGFPQTHLGDAGNRNWCVLSTAGINSITISADSPNTVPTWPITESLVVFETRLPRYSNPADQSTTISWTSCTTQETADAIYSSLKNYIGVGQSILFQLVDRKTELPVTYFRLSWNGFLTTTPSVDFVKFSLKTYYLRPLSIILTTTPIPTPNAAMLQNALQLSNRDSLEKLRKKISKKKV